MLVHETRQQKLKHLIDASTLHSIAERTNRSKSQLSDVASGRKKMGERLARNLEKELQLPAGFFDIVGDGLETALVEQKAVPLVRWEDLDKPDILLSTQPTILTNMEVKHGAAIALLVRDKSMSPDIDPEDIVLVDSCLKPEPGDFVLAKTPNGYVIRKFRLLTEETCELVPVNDDWPRISGKDIEIKGVLIEIRKYPRRKSSA